MPLKHLFIALLLIATGTLALADASSTNSFYLPYVQPLEKEIEFQRFYLDDTQNSQATKLAYAQALTDTLSLELALIGQNDDDDSLDVDTTELELLWQLTEQGEYSVDWGMMVELEHEQYDNRNELAVGLLTMKEWQQWTCASNTYLIYEKSDTIKAEMEFALNLQLAYRLSASFSPALEFYSGEGSRTIGPVIMGSIRLPDARRLSWSLGYFHGLNEKTTDATYRLQLEYEFF